MLWALPLFWFVLTSENKICAVHDFDMDGFPDEAEFRSPSERKSFMDWFAAIAEHIARRGHPDIHDCSSFVVFCYKEALKRHDFFWRKGMRFHPRHNIPDKRSFYYPKVPILGTKIFRVKDGKFGCDLEKEFSVSSTAENLLRCNMVFVSRNIEEAANGDIIAFYHPRSNMPYHLMVVVRKPDGIFLAYHTGPEGEKAGIFKFISLRTLMNHPDRSWWPIEDNPSFLGVFHWKIVE